MPKLSDNAPIFDVRDTALLEHGRASFIMLAPMQTLRHVFKLQPEAEQRILRETDHGGSCELHFHQGPWGTITVAREDML